MSAASKSLNLLSTLGAGDREIYRLRGTLMESSSGTATRRRRRRVVPRLPPGRNTLAGVEAVDGD